MTTQTQDDQEGLTPHKRAPRPSRRARGWFAPGWFPRLFQQVRMPIWYGTCLCMFVWSFTHAYPYWVSFTLLSSSLGWQAAPISAQLREIILRLLSK